MRMKTAISVPDEVFKLSEKLAKKLRVSRSAVFAMGIKKLDEELDKEAMIARINKVCAEVDTSLDPVLREYTFRKLREVEW
jgi:predicted transcriptional regulator